VVTSGHESKPIPFSPLLIAVKCWRYVEELLLGPGSGINGSVRSPQLVALDCSMLHQETWMWSGD
jgi:hypothetical protein